jgi:hypothetical protein
MGGRTSEGQEETQGNIGIKRTDNQTTCRRPAGRRQKPQVAECVTADLIKITLDHFFPDFPGNLSELADPRRPDRIVYSKEHLFYLGLSMFLFHCGSRSQLESERGTPAFRHNLLALSGTDEKQTASVEAMNYLMENMSPGGGMEELPGQLLLRLINSRALDKYRNSHGEFMIAIDAVHLFTRKGRWLGAVYKKIGGKTHSCYYALEAKLVTSDGFAFSLGTLFIETEEEYVKQDCELKAFYRLEEILKKRFPRLPICLLLDGLYANKNVLDICEKNRWGYYITFKDGSIPNLYAAMLAKLDASPAASVDNQPEPGVLQHISWALNLKHEGRSAHALFCREMTIAKDGIKVNNFVWLTDARPDKHNAATLAEEARNRWIIENQGFNVQKNEGYELEHNYGTVGFAMKNYYYLLQIAHMLHQLMVKSDLFPKLQRKFIMLETQAWPEKTKIMLAAIATNTLEHFRTVKNFVKRLAESFRNQIFSALATNPEALGKIQIRFCSD